MAIQRHDHDGELRGLLYSETAPDNKGKRFDSPDFGYGALGAGGATVPNATLVFRCRAARSEVKAGVANLTSIIVLSALLGIPLLSQGRVSPEPILLGPIGNRLTAADRAQITALAAKSGGTPWIMEGTVTYLADEVRWYVNVYLPPDREASRLRRGRILTMTTTLPARASEAMEKTWRAASSSEYGQVPVPGTQPDVVSSGRDLNRPFRITVPLTDEQVVSIADFVRTSPSVPRMVGWPNGSRVEGSWPIRGLLRDSTHGALVAVALLGPGQQESSGQRIALVADSGAWTIIRFWLFVSG